MRRHPRKPLSSQRGVVAIILFMILFMAGASLFLTYVNNNVVNQQADLATMQAMRDAKEALISYAVLHGDYYGAAGAGPGHLPCPDSNGNGAENMPCSINALGRIPQSVTLPSGAVFPLSSYNSNIDAQLWYGLANEVRRSPSAAFNSSTTSNLTLDGQGGVAAVLIAPGEGLPSQSRGNNNDANYLEAGNAGGPNFVTNNPADPDNFNDRVLSISIVEIMSPVTARIAETMKVQLDNFHTTNGNYPVDQTAFNGAFGAAPAWLAANNWPAVTSYVQVDDDTATLVFDSCNITYTLSNTAGTITRTSSRC